MANVALGAGVHAIPGSAVPRGWRAVQVRDVARVCGGGRWGLTKEDDYTSSGVPAFSAAGQDGFVGTAEYDGVDGVVLSSIGAQCGKTFLATGRWTTLANTQAILPGGSLDSRYLQHRVNDADYWPRSGTAQPFIKPSDIGKCWILLPPLPEQRRIAAILDTLDTAIRKTEEVIAKLRQMKQGLLHDLLTRGIDENGELRDPERHREQFKESAIGAIPRDWVVSSVEGEFAIQAGMTLGPHRVPRDHPFPYLRVANVHRGRLALDDVAQLEARPTEVVDRLLEVGDILVVEGHADVAAIGRAAMADARVAGMTFQNHLFRLRAHQLRPGFAAWWMNSGSSRESVQWMKG